jgi:hypothetical protein
VLGMGPVGVLVGGEGTGEDFVTHCDYLKG